MLPRGDTPFCFVFKIFPRKFVFLQEKQKKYRDNYTFFIKPFVCKSRLYL